MKQCNKCKEVKELDRFNVSKAMKDGHQAVCRVCSKKISREIYWKDPEKARSIQKRYAKDNPEKIKVRNDRFRANNPEKVILNNTEYRKNNLEKSKKDCSQWKKDNPDKVNSINTRRYAKKLNAIPPWLTKEQYKEIQEFYTLAKELQWLSEESLEVDHIIPLQGKNVSGLHVPWNLQILPKSINIKKSNKTNTSY